MYFENINCWKIERRLSLGITLETSCDDGLFEEKYIKIGLLIYEIKVVL